MQKRPMTGLNAHNSLNLALIKYLGSSHKITTPPPTPSTPPFPRTFSISPLGDGNFCISWTSPILTTIFMIINFWAMPGRADSTILRWQLGLTASSDSLHCTVATDLPDATIVRFRIRTIDEYGRLSPWSHQEASVVPVPGIFGYTAFGWSYFGPAA